MQRKVPCAGEREVVLILLVRSPSYFKELQKQALIWFWSYCSMICEKSPDNGNRRSSCDYSRRSFFVHSTIISVSLFENRALLCGQDDFVCPPTRNRSVCSYVPLRSTLIFDVEPVLSRKTMMRKILF